MYFVFMIVASIIVLIASFIVGFGLGVVGSAVGMTVQVIQVIESLIIFCIGLVASYFAFRLAVEKYIVDRLETDHSIF